MSDYTFKPATPEEIRDLSKKSLGDIIPKEKSEVTENEQSPSNIDKDFEGARDNIKSIVEKGNGILDDMIALAKASDHPRAFEVAGSLINTLISANKDLLEIYEKKNKIKGVSQKTPEPTQTNIQNNTVFVGSPNELLDILSKKEISVDE